MFTTAVIVADPEWNSNPAPDAVDDDVAEMDATPDVAFTPVAATVEDDVIDPAPAA